MLPNEQPARRYPRIKAPIKYRPARDLSQRRPVIDVGMGGLRVHSDHLFEAGSMWDIDVLRTDGSGIICTVRVVWSRPDPPHGYEIGLEFVELPAQAEDFFANILADYA